MKRNAIKLLPILLVAPLIACSNGNASSSSSSEPIVETVIIKVNGTPISLEHEPYIQDEVFFADIKEISPHFNGEADYSNDGKICFAAFNTTMIIIEEGLSSFTITDLITQDYETHPLLKPSKKTEYGIDVSIEDIGDALGYIVTKNNTVIEFNNEL